MAYLTQQQFVDLFGEGETIALTNIDNAAAETINATRFTAANNWATSIIDSYMPREFAVLIPNLETLPIILVGYAADLVRYQLAKNNIPPESDIRLRYEDAIKWLKLLSEKKVNPFGNAELEEEAVTLTAGMPDAYGARTFTFGTMEGF